MRLRCWRMKRGTGGREICRRRQGRGRPWCWGRFVLRRKLNVPADAGSDFAKHPAGSGPFGFVGQKRGDGVVLERAEIRKEANSRQSTVLETTEEKRRSLASRTSLGMTKPQERPASEGGPYNFGTKIRRVTFRIVPDAIVRALELRKGSADVEVSSLSADTIPVLVRQPQLEVTERRGTNFAYLGMNLEDPILRKREVREALAYATDRESLVKYLLRGEARLASGILPPNHWAYEGNVKTYGYDRAKADKLLDVAGYARDTNGVRLDVTLKVSTEEQARLIGAALQEQWKKVGVALEVRPLQIATLFADLERGNSQISYL